MKDYKFGKGNLKFRTPGKSFKIGDHAKLRALQRFGWDFPFLKDQAQKSLENGDQYKHFHIFDGKLFLFNQARGGGLRLVTVLDFDEYEGGQYK